MNMEQFRDFMVSRLFERNHFETSQALLAAIEAACAIDENRNWRAAKDAFNAIGVKAPLTDDNGMCIRYQDVPGLIQNWCEAYATFASASTSDDVDRNNPDNFDMQLWDQIKPNWFNQIVGAADVQLKAEPGFGWELTAREDGKPDQSPQFIPIFGDALVAADHLVHDLAKSLTRPTALTVAKA